MASLRKKTRSPYWFACFYAADGRRVQRSTKQTNRKKAQALADAYEKAAKLASEKRLGESQARRVLSDIYESVTGERLASSTARDYLTRWIERRKADTAQSTHAGYAQVVRDFIASLGSRADMDISQLGKADVAKYRDAVLARTSIASANKALKFLRVALGAAYKDGVTQENVAAKLDTLKRPAGGRSERRGFTLPEMRRILAHASGDWQGMILFGFYTGQRLRDIARLTWANIDTARRELRFVTAKTGRNMFVPLAPPLLSFIATMDAGDDPAAPLFPELCRLSQGLSGASRLSQQFHAILAAAGLATPQGKEETGRGHGFRRALNPLSFHSLRHTATSLLKNAGVSAVVAMDIIGHESEAISRHYTHVDEGAKHAAIAGLPDLLTGKSNGAKANATHAAKIKGTRGTK